MTPAIEEQIEKLKNTISEMEAQRAALGDSLVQKAVEPLRAKLEELTRQIETSRVVRAEKSMQQRKLVTILFMDIVGSTSIIQHMDPEDVGEIFDANLKRLAQPVEDQGGRITSFAGDGYLAIFGAPTAREDDPERAVRAGLAVLERSKEIGAELEKQWNIHDFKVRVGVNTGLVLLGGETEGEDTTKGPAVHLAARLQSAAPAGGMLVSHDTYRHIRGVFDVEPWEPIQVKGFDEPVRAYRILSAKPRAFRSYTRGVEGVETRMVGRESELKYMQDALLNVLETGEGQVITISGEAGVGKSRLIEEFQNWVDLRPERVWLFQGRGLAEGQQQPYGLLRDVFANRFEILEDDTAEILRQKFVSGLQQGLNEQAEMKTHLLGQLLGYDFSDSPHMKGVMGESEQLRNRGLMCLGEYFTCMARQRLVVMFLEDVHWSDDSTLDAIDWLEERMGKLGMLVVCAGRDALYERRPYWGEGEEHHSRLALKPLTKRLSRELVQQILHQVTNLPESLRELIVEGAEGNPFYLEELIKMLFEDGVIVTGEPEWYVEKEQLQKTSVPSTLTGVLQARLDGLPAEERKVLQEASVVGRHFWDRLVAYVDTGGMGGAIPGLLQETLSSLRNRELIFRHEASAFAQAREYLFKHDLLRDVTYESVLKKVRRVHHGLVADWLIANVGDRIREYAGVIAEHLALGGRNQEAIEYLLQAGEASLAGYSNREAEAFYRRILVLKPSEMQQAKALHGLGNALFIQGKREEAAEVFRQAIEIFSKLGNIDVLAEVYSRFSKSEFRAEFQDGSKSWLICQHALEELKSAADSPGLANLLHEAGKMAWFTRQPNEVVTSYCRRAVQIGARLGLLEVQLNAKITLGLANPNVHESIQIMNDVAAEAEANGLSVIGYRAYFNLGAQNCHNYDFSSGAECQQKSIMLARRMGWNGAVLWGVQNLVLDYFIIGKQKEIPDLFSRLLEGVVVQQKWMDDHNTLLAYWSRYYNGEWCGAIELARQMLSEARQNGDVQNIMRNEFRFAYAWVDQVPLISQGDPVEAMTNMCEYVEMKRKSPSPHTYEYFLVAQVLVMAGQLEEGRQILKEAERLWSGKDYTDNHFRDNTYYQLAVIENRWDEAVAIATSLVTRYENSGACWYHARQLITLGDALCGRDQPGDREQAEAVYRRSLEMFTEMGAPGYIKVLEERLKDFI